MLGAAQVAVQGVNNYPADVACVFDGGGASGGQNMAQLIAQAMSRCPETKLCVSGYSQGDGLVGWGDVVGGEEGFS